MAELKERTVNTIPEWYDPLQLTHEVYRLLLDKGFPVERIGDLNAAVEGAGMILRYLGLEPVIPAASQEYRRMDHDGHLAYNRRVHQD